MTISRHTLPLFGAVGLIVSFTVMKATAAHRVQYVAHSLSSPTKIRRVRELTQDLWREIPCFTGTPESPSSKHTSRLNRQPRHQRCWYLRRYSRASPARSFLKTARNRSALLLFRVTTCYLCGVCKRSFGMLVDAARLFFFGTPAPPCLFLKENPGTDVQHQEYATRIHSLSRDDKLLVATRKLVR